jgi:hypothetical protein
MSALHPIESLFVGSKQAGVFAAPIAGIPLETLPFELVNNSALHVTAQIYSQYGVNIFPSRFLEKEPGLLKPADGPGGFHQATADWRSIGIWWRPYKHQPFNISYATGLVNGFLIIDSDGPVAKTFWAEMEKRLGKLPPTLKVLTRRGDHRLYRMPADGLPIRCSTGVKGGPEDGADIKGDGGYAVAPGSIRDDGFVYKFDTSESSTLADLPAAWVDFLRNRKSAGGGNNRKSGTSTGPIACLDGGTPAALPARKLRSINVSVPDDERRSTFAVYSTARIKLVFAIFDVIRRDGLDRVAYLTPGFASRALGKDHPSWLEPIPASHLHFIRSDLREFSELGFAAVAYLGWCLRDTRYQGADLSKLVSDWVGARNDRTIGQSVGVGTLIHLAKEGRLTASPEAVARLDAALAAVAAEDAVLEAQTSPGAAVTPPAPASVQKNALATPWEPPAEWAFTTANLQEMRAALYRFDHTAENAVKKVAQALANLSAQERNPWSLAVCKALFLVFMRHAKQVISADVHEAWDACVNQANDPGRRRFPSFTYRTIDRNLNSRQRKKK